ncbi:MAG: serpin family protein, partial [Lentisphaeria bacterium]|nr:serpin family protein [Lentisphaeria bacterium]
TALPFIVQAQSGAKTNGSQEITLTLEGAIRGGRFFFKENTIQFDTLNKYEWPQKDILVNGKPWSELNKPFELEFTPDFAKAVILEKMGGPEGRTYVLPRENLFALMIVPDDADSKPAPFRVKLAVKNQVQHDNLPPDETPAGKTRRSAARRQTAQSDSDGEIRSITIVQTGTTAADRKIAADLNRKGFELFRLLSEKNANENAFISPYSIDSAFGLVYCGAKDKTAEEIRTTLGLPDDPAACGRFFSKVSKEYAVNKLVEVLVSNSVWYEQKFEKDILPSFVSMIREYYGRTFYKEDFSKPDALAAKVNGYVEDRTKSMIKDLLSPADIKPDIFMILLNTLYFEAKWETPFEKENTRPMVFHNFDGWEKRVKMMHRRGFDIGYCSDERDNVHAVVLPYEDLRFELVALMPILPGADQGKAAMQDIISKLGTRLDSWLAKRSEYETLLWLPVTDLTCRYDLNDALGTLGMKTPFSMTQADFHGIAEPTELLKYIWIDKVIHKTALKMDEESTKAAAATAITMAFGGLAAPREQPPVNTFRADRPFIVLIRDSRTGLILFAGRITDPGVEAQQENFGFGGRRAPSFAPAAPDSAASID